MAAPIVSWRLGDNSDVMERWDIGRINAGDEGDLTEILIWNNFAGEEDVAHMQDCRFTTTDGSTDTLDVITGKWVHVRCDSTEDDEFKQVGGLDKKVIGAKGAEVGVVQGTANTGDLEDEKNYSKITVFFKSDLHGVAAGPRNFKLRTEFFYV